MESRSPRFRKKSSSPREAGRANTSRSPLIGVLALQGAFSEHLDALAACRAAARPVRLSADLDGLDGLVIPGGESTTMMLLMDRMGLWEPVGSALAAGLPALGTCAGMILLAQRVLDGVEGQRSFAVLDAGVRRNAYGRQPDSFEAEIEVEGLDSAFPGVFIRAPVVEDTGSAEVIARLDGRPVGLLQGSVMALAFHPELSGDFRLHREFLRLVEASQ